MAFMFAYTFISRDRFFFTLNGHRDQFLRSEHPAMFAIYGGAGILVGLLLFGVAFYVHFGLKWFRRPASGPWGFSWFGVIPFCIALLFILVALLVSLFRH